MEALSDDVDGGSYDLGTTSVRLIRVGSVIQIFYSNPLEAKFIYRELAERYKREEEELRRE